MFDDRLVGCPNKQRLMFITLYDNNEVSPELTSFLQELKPEVDNYANAKAQAQRSRMMIIGRINDYKNTFPQRSTDHRLLRQAMNSEWSSDVIEKAITAYNEYNRLLDTGVEEYVSVAENANPSQLVTLSRGEGTTLAYDAARHFKQTGSLPSKGKMEQHLKGRLDKSFSSRPGADTQREAPTQTTTTPVTPYITLTPEQQAEELEFKRMGVYDPTAKSHLRSLVSNENLQYINTIRTARVWNLDDADKTSAIACIEQKMSQSPVFAEMIYNLACKYKQEQLRQTIDVPVTGVFDNQIHNGIRFRR